MAKYWSPYSGARLRSAGWCYFTADMLNYIPACLLPRLVVEQRERAMKSRNVKPANGTKSRRPDDQRKKTKTDTSMTYRGIIYAGSCRVSEIHCRIKQAEELASPPIHESAQDERTAVSNATACSCYFSDLANDFLDTKRPELSEREWRNLRNLIKSHNGPVRYFHAHEIGDLTTDAIRKYLRFAAEESTKGKLSPFTLRRHVSAVAGILRLAAERQLISAIPPMPRIKAKDAPRAWFPAAEYRRLCTTAHALGQNAQRRGDSQDAADWHELGDLIALLVNSFLRPGEWKNLRHRHIAADRRGPNPHLLIVLERSKTGARTVASMPSGVKIYDRIVARSGCSPDDHLFLNRYSNRQTAQDKVWRLFRKLLEKTGLRFDPHGRARTLYSLRHTSLMLRLLRAENLDLLTLARAGGTSVPMLERFYLSHLGPAMKLADLQSFKGRKGT